MPKPAPLRMTLLGLKSDAVEHVLAEQALVQEDELRMLRDLVVAERNHHEHLRSRIAWAEQQLQQAESLANQGTFIPAATPPRTAPRVNVQPPSAPPQVVTPESAEQQLARMRRALVDMLGDMRPTATPTSPQPVPAPTQAPTHVPTSAYVQTTHVHTTHVHTSAHVQTPAPAAPFQEPARFNPPAAPFQEPARFNPPAAPVQEPARFNPPAAPIPEPARFNPPAAPVQEPARYNPPALSAQPSVPTADTLGKSLVDLNGQKLVSPFQLSPSKPVEPPQSAAPALAPELVTVPQLAQAVEPVQAVTSAPANPARLAGDLAPTFAAPKPNPVAAAQVRSQINAAMLRILSGKMVGQDLLDEAGHLVAARGTMITAEVATRAETAGVLADLVLHMVWPEGTDA